MSDVTSTLTELAAFVGRPKLGADTAHRRAVGDGGHALPARSQKRSVTELLASVLALSARTRRLVQPRATIELDVFSPGGERAVKLYFGD